MKRAVRPDIVSEEMVQPIADEIDEAGGAIRQQSVERCTLHIIQNYPSPDICKAYKAAAIYHVGQIDFNSPFSKTRHQTVSKHRVS